MIEDKISIDLTYWECSRIVLALINQNMALPSPGIHQLNTLGVLYRQQQELLNRIDLAAFELIKRQQERIKVEKI